jgi:hypothetical protein
MSRNDTVHRFSHEGEEYEVRVSRSTTGISARAFKDGQPVNGLTYSVSWETKVDFEDVYTDAVDGLIALAKGDVVRS